MICLLKSIRVNIGVTKLKNKNKSVNSNMNSRQEQHISDFFFVPRTKTYKSRSY
jgi:hypothetical protein